MPLTRKMSTMNEEEIFSTFIVDDDEDSRLDVEDFGSQMAHNAGLSRHLSSSTWHNSTPTDSPSPLSGTSSSDFTGSPKFTTPFSPTLDFAGLDVAPAWPLKMEDMAMPDILASDMPLGTWDQWPSMGEDGTVSPSQLLTRPGFSTFNEPLSPGSPEYFDSSVQSNSSAAPSVSSPRNPRIEITPDCSVPLPKSLDERTVVALTLGQNTNNNYGASRSSEWHERRQQLQRIAFGLNQNSSGRILPKQEPNNEPETKSRKKRKSGMGPEAFGEGSDESKPAPKKTAHNMIEKRYRTNLNDKIAALRDSVPSLRVAARAGQEIGDEEEEEDLDGLKPAHKLNKATVMAKATEYIKHLETRGKSLGDENEELKLRLEAFEQLAKMSGVDFGLPTPDPEVTYTPQQFAQQATPGPAGPGPMTLPVPVPARKASVSRPQATPVSRKNTRAEKKPGQSIMGKLVVGSLGGLMLVQGFKEHEPTSNHGSRGLFAMPTQALRWVANSLGSSHVSISLGSSSAHLDILSLFRAILIFGAIIYIVSSLVWDSSSDEKEGVEAETEAVTISAPLENRRKAWLTAVQTVWVPRDSLLPNVVVLSIKAVKLCIRKLLGWKLFSLVSGFTDEQEGARIKAWEIALDAQLAGGDSEISSSRLFLSLLASNTIPKSPVRLMLRALHVRVLHWRLSSESNGIWVPQDLVDSYARNCWNKARTLHGAKPAISSHFDHNEPLPDHLAALLNLDYEEVFLDTLVQRAYNLCWNKPTTSGIDQSDPKLDAVVDDLAVRSSLDALAAWLSSLMLNKVFASVLSSAGNTSRADVEADIELTESIAPPDSGAQQRAHVAKIAFASNDGKSSLETLRSLLEELDGLSQPPTPAEQDVGSDQRVLQLLNGVSLALENNSDLSVATRCASALAFARSEPRTTVRTAIAMRLFNSLAQHKFFKACANGNSKAAEVCGREIGQLGFTASWKALQVFSNDEQLAHGCMEALERVAGGLRIWMGGEMGRSCNLDRKDRGFVVESCLKVSKRVMGMREAEEEDLGYETQSEKA